MTTRNARLVSYAAVLALSLCCLDACNKGIRSRSIRSSDCCADYQHSDSLPDQPPKGAIRLAIGGDSRNDSSHVVPWAFKEARKWGAKAFFFLGDLEFTRAQDRLFAPQLADLGDIPFYLAIGNHEAELLGVRLPGNHAVKEFKEDFLKGLDVYFAPLDDEVVYSADLGNAVHFIALDNVSRKHEGFGSGQLAWLEGDLSAARAANKVILVGMHKALANNPVTTHAMDEDGANAIRDSEAALALFKKYKVAMVFVSHSHMYASYKQDGVDVRLTGGMGAPLVKGLKEADGGFHHFLLVDVPPAGDTQTPLQVEVVRFHDAPPSKDDQDEANEAEAKAGSSFTEFRAFPHVGFLLVSTLAKRLK